MLLWLVHFQLALYLVEIIYLFFFLEHLAVEQFIINRFGQIDGVKLRFEVQSEEGVDIPDVYGTFYGKDFNVEVKMFDAQISSLSINDIDISKGKFTVKKMKNLSTKNQIKMQELLAQMLPPVLIVTGKQTF